MRPRDNPFRVSRLEGLEYRFREGDWGGAIDRLRALRWRGAVVGPHGAGKTTFLRQLSPRLSSTGFEVRAVRLTEGERGLSSSDRRRLFRGVDPSVLLMVDGVDELSTFSWWELRRRTATAGGLVVATHREGRLPTWHRCRPSAPLLEALVDDLHEGCTCSLPPFEQLFLRNGGNVRHALWELYDLHARPASSLHHADQPR